MHRHPKHSLRACTFATATAVRCPSQDAQVPCLPTLNPKKGVPTTHVPRKTLVSVVYLSPPPKKLVKGHLAGGPRLVRPKTHRALKAAVNQTLLGAKPHGRCPFRGSVDGRNPLRTPLKPLEAIVHWPLQGNHQSRVSLGGAGFRPSTVDGPGR